MTIEKQLTDDFLKYFPGNNDGIRLYFAPGRVNLIGEHTDYNGGYVLPATLSLGTYMAVRLRQDNEYHIESANFPNKSIHFSTSQCNFVAEDDWGNYPKGVIGELAMEGVTLKGADIYYYGDIPNGAGLSSSASLTMVTAFGLCQLSNHAMSIKDMALLCQRVENHFMSVNTGIMDQFAVGFGEQDHAIFLNCRTLDYQLVPLQLGEYKLVITNTNKRRGLADSKYNERRQQCETGLDTIKKDHPTFQDLTDVSADDFQAAEDQFDPLIKKRVRHVVTENSRVLSAVEELKEGKLQKFGQLMNASHQSLRKDYEVTGDHLDILFDTQKKCQGCIGTRMTGAGFGGCTISIVHQNDIDNFKEHVTKEYQDKTGLEPSFYICEVGGGVKELGK